MTEVHMTRTEFNEKLLELSKLAEKARKIAKDLMDVAEIDGIFIKTGPMYQRKEGALIPKYEKRSVICLWEHASILADRATRHYDNCKDERDELAEVKFE